MKRVKHKMEEYYPNPVQGRECLLTRLNRGCLKDIDEIDKLNYILWGFSVAYEHAKKSPDISTQVGAAIIDPKNQFICGDNNHFVNGFEHKDIRLEDSEYKNMVVQHAEKNTIRKYVKNEGKDPTGLAIVTTWTPCAGCAADIIEHGITTVYTDYNILKFGRKIRSKKSFTMWEKSAHAALDQFEELGIEFIAFEDLPNFGLSDISILVSGNEYYPFNNNQC